MTSSQADKGKVSKRCAKCGACTVVCPVFRASGGKEFYSGRGKKYLLDVMGEETPSPIFEDIFSKCLLCGACVSSCPRDVDIPEEVRQARADFSRFYGEHGYQKFLARKVLERPDLLGVARRFGRTFSNLLDEKLPSDSGLRLRLAIFNHNSNVPFSNSLVKRTAERSSLVYFPGCSGTHLYPEIIAACEQLFNTAGYSLVIPEGLVCCGLAMDSAGDVDVSRQLAKKISWRWSGLTGQLWYLVAHVLRIYEDMVTCWLMSRPGRTGWKLSVNAL